MLTPKQLVAAIKLDEAIKAGPPSKVALMTSIGRTPPMAAPVDEPWATNPTHFTPRDHAGTPAPRSKPPRIEKWQRWRSPSYEYVCTNVGKGGAVTLKCGEFTLTGWQECLLAEGSSGWDFLGYASPTHVEAGQRWLHRAKGVIEIAVVDECWATTTNGERYGVDLCRHPSWEYLGMADRASVDDASTENGIEKAIEQIAIVTGQPKGSVRAAIEDIRQQYSPNMLERLGELFDSVKAPPTVGWMPFPIAAPTKGFV